MNRINIGLNNSLTPIQRQAIIYTNAALLSIGAIGTNFGEIFNRLHNFSFTKVLLKTKMAVIFPGWDGKTEFEY